MNQITKFYLTSFLKNQSFYVPVFVVLLQFYHLSLNQVFWVLTIGNIIAFIVEIPTGIIADRYGKKRSIILAKLLILTAFIIYGFSRTFWVFVAAEAVYRLGNAFRTGTEAAYVYDYIKQEKPVQTYTEVKGKQKFYARVGEALASLVGGFIASTFGFNWVFHITAIPAFANLLITISWSDISERARTGTHYLHLKDSLAEIKHSKLTRLILNISIFQAVLVTALTFVQPYMQSISIPISLFGIVYALSLGISAIAVRYSYVLNNKYGELKSINWLTYISIIPLVILGLGYNAIAGIGLFFFLVVIQNFRSPISNSLFHDRVRSRTRATMGSMLAQAISFVKIMVLPIAGYLADAISIQGALIALSLIMALNAVWFKIGHVKLS